MELQQVYLMTTDLQRASAFYSALGFEIADEGSRSVEFETGRAKLKLEADFDPETLSAFGLEPPGENRGDGAVIVLAVENVDAVAEAADTATDEYGGEVLTGPRDVDWGVDSSFLLIPMVMYWSYRNLKRSNNGGSVVFRIKGEGWFRHPLCMRNPPGSRQDFCLNRI